MSATIENTVEQLVREERRRQRAVHSFADFEREEYEWLGILVEEVGEVARAINLAGNPAGNAWTASRPCRGQAHAWLEARLHRLAGGQLPGGSAAFGAEDEGEGRGRSPTSTRAVRSRSAGTSTDGEHPVEEFLEIPVP
jgi:hypothetical protein